MIAYVFGGFMKHLALLTQKPRENSLSIMAVDYCETVINTAVNYRFKAL